MESLADGLLRSRQSRVFISRPPIKHSKTPFQTIILRNYFEVFSTSREKNAVVAKIITVTGLSSKQIYKWMWDEEIRRRNFSWVEHDKIRAESVSMFEAMTGFFEEKCPIDRTYVLETVMVPRRQAAGKKSLQLLKRKMKALAQEPFVFIRK